METWTNKQPFNIIIYSLLVAHVILEHSRHDDSKQ